MRKILTIIAFLALSSTAYSQTVKGVVLDERYFPVPGVTVQIEGGGSTKSDSNGEFSIPIESKPYTLTLIEKSAAVAVRYEGLTTTEPELRMFGVRSGKHANTEGLKVTFPAVTGSAVIKFISQDLFYSTEATATGGETTKLLTVEWPSNKESISGFLIYLSKNQNNYTQYLEYPLTLFKGSNTIQTVDLTYPGSSSDPGSSTVNVYLPNFKYNSKGYSIYADFLGLNRNASILLSTAEADIQNTKVLVPMKLPFAFRLKVSGNATFKDGSSFINYTYTQPQSTVNIENETPPEILAPQDKLIGFSGNTRFSYETGSGTGIFVAHFHSFFPEGDFYVVTTSRNITAPVTRSYGVLDGNEFQWSVSKHMLYFDVDDFVKPVTFQNDLGYKAVTYSEKRTFKKSF